MRIVFMGTPDFAVESLKVLVEDGYNVVGVITMPDKPAGRGHKIQYSAVKQYAIENNLTVLQPERLKDEVFIEQLRGLKADLQVVVAFRMLPEIVWDMPPRGTFNLHASLLPQYRGAAPINWAVINGEKETGVTTFFLKHEIDTGEIIMQEKIDINEDDDAGIVHDKLMVLGAQLVKRTVDLIIAGKADTKEQSQFISKDTELKSAPKLFKDNCRLDFSKTVEEVHNHVRGLSPYPAAWTELLLPGTNEPIVFKVYKTETEVLSHTHAIGEVFSDGKSCIKVAAANGFVSLLELQAPGKKRMDVGSFLRGFKG
ncbi:methionyl-tRNA formyltransferase [Paludibacter sp.]